MKAREAFMRDTIKTTDRFLKDITDPDLKDLLKRLTNMLEVMVKADRAGLQIPKKYINKMNDLLDHFDFHIEKGT
jgi:hypothetical protein